MTEETPRIPMKLELLQINASLYQLLGLLPLQVEQAQALSIQSMNHVFHNFMRMQDPLNCRLADMCLEDGFEEHFDLYEIVNGRWHELSASLEALKMQIARRWLIEGGPRPDALNFMPVSIEAYLP